MAGQRQSISDGELEIARILWSLGQATVRQVFEGGAADRGHEFTTVQTYLRRLEQKGYVTAKLVGKTRQYKPRVRPKTVIRQTVDDLIDRLFDGETLPLVKHLVEDRTLTENQITELREMIDRIEREQRETGR